MPEVPALMADLVGRAFSSPITVEAITPYAPRLRRLRFRGDKLRAVRFRPGIEIEFRAGRRELRHYTPANIDTARGTMEVVFFLHGLGPGSRWVNALREKDDVGLLGPGGSFGLRTGAAGHLLLGDDSCLGLFEALVDGAGQSLVRGTVEVEPELRGVAATLLPRLDALPRERRGDALAGWLEDAMAAWPAIASGGDGWMVYLCGHTTTIRRLRARLLSAGWSRRHIKTRAYWAGGKRGL